MAETSVCPFCKALKDYNDDLEYYRGRRESLRNSRTEHKVAMVTRHYDNPNYPNWCTGALTHELMELNFCPVCGKEIEAKLKTP